MDWQQLVSLTIVGATAGWMLWNRFRRRPAVAARRHLPCCGPGQIRPPSIVFHARKGQRPEIRVKA